MCQGLNSHYFHIIGDGHQPNSRGFYTPIIRIPIKGGRSPIPNIATFDYGTYDYHVKSWWPKSHRSRRFLAAAAVLPPAMAGQLFGKLSTLTWKVFKSVGRWMERVTDTKSTKRQQNNGGNERNRVLETNWCHVPKKACFLIGISAHRRRWVEVGAHSCRIATSVKSGAVGSASADPVFLQGRRRVYRKSIRPTKFFLVNLDRIFRVIWWGVSRLGDEVEELFAKCW